MNGRRKCGNRKKGRKFVKKRMTTRSTIEKKIKSEKKNHLICYSHITSHHGCLSPSSASSSHLFFYFIFYFCVLFLCVCFRLKWTLINSMGDEKNINNNRVLYVKCPSRSCVFFAIFFSSFVNAVACTLNRSFRLYSAFIINRTHVKSKN